MIVRRDAQALLALSSDRWGALLPHVRRALNDLPDTAVTPSIARLRASPASALASGRTRRDLATLLAQDESVWHALVALLEPLPDDLAWLAHDDAPEVVASDGGRAPAGSDEHGTAGTDAHERARLRDRLRDAHQERDQAKRRADGAEARAERATRRGDQAEARLAEVLAEAAELEVRLAEHATETRRAVEREARRHASELATLRSDLTAARGRIHELERALDEERVRHRRREQERARPAGTPERPDPSGLKVGRPTRLPAGVAPDTSEAAELLLAPGRQVLVDGYNVTLRHREGLGLEQQRAWLVRALATFVARVPIRPVVVFDGDRSGGGSRSMPRAPGVQVRFTVEGTIADDEIVFAVEATDGPVVVVTDDQDLRARVAALGADVVGTVNLVGVIGA